MIEEKKVTNVSMKIVAVDADGRWAEGKQSRGAITTALKRRVGGGTSAACFSARLKDVCDIPLLLRVPGASLSDAVIPQKALMGLQGLSGSAITHTQALCCVVSGGLVTARRLSALRRRYLTKCFVWKPKKGRRQGRTMESHRQPYRQKQIDIEKTVGFLLNDLKKHFFCFVWFF